MYVYRHAYNRETNNTISIILIKYISRYFNYIFKVCPDLQVGSYQVYDANNILNRTDSLSFKQNKTLKHADATHCE